MIAWRRYQGGLCKCGFPKATAWHHFNAESFELDGEFICYACTAAEEPDKDGKVTPVTYPVVIDKRDYVADPLVGPPEPQVLPDH